jgi:hypothetical protein
VTGSPGYHTVVSDERSADRQDLVEPEGVNAGSAAAERDRRPDGQVGATADAVRPSAPPARDDPMVGAPGQRDDSPGQQMEEGEG